MSMRDDGALVLFSGGQDSTTCPAWALEQFEHVETVGFDYGQRHRVELDCRDRVRNGLTALAPALAAKLGAEHKLALDGPGTVSNRSAELRVGHGWVRSCKSWWVTFTS